MPQTLLFELPASFLESDQFTRVMDNICAVTGPAAQDVIDIVSRLAKEILALRFHAAKLLRVAHLYQTGVDAGVGARVADESALGFLGTKSSS